MDLRPREGWVAPELARELAGLGLVHATVEARPGRSPPGVRRRLRHLADRYTGGKAVHLRRSPVPWAYRVLARQIGLDPDSERTPVEGIALRRLEHGGLRSEGLVEDALTIAIAETGVPVIALDAARVDPDLGLRLARPGERLGPRRLLSERQLVVADGARPVALVMGEVAEDAGVGPATARVVLAALRARDVPRIGVDEALWTAAEVLVYS